MTEFVTLALGMIAGVAIGLVLVIFYVRMKIRQMGDRFDDLIREAIREVEGEMVAITVERHSDVFYCYRRDDQQFVAQGATIAEIRDACRRALPGKLVYVDGGDPGAVSELQAAMAQPSEETQRPS